MSELARDTAHTIGIESFWPMLRRGYQGTDCKMRGKHLGLYVNESLGRQNVGDLIVGRLLTNLFAILTFREVLQI